MDKLTMTNNILKLTSLITGGGPVEINDIYDLTLKIFGEDTDARSIAEDINAASRAIAVSLIIVNDNVLTVCIDATTRSHPINGSGVKACFVNMDNERGFYECPEFACDQIISSVFDDDPLPKSTLGDSFKYVMHSLGLIGNSSRAQYQGTQSMAGPGVFNSGQSGMYGDFGMYGRPQELFPPIADTTPKAISVLNNLKTIDPRAIGELISIFRQLGIYDITKHPRLLQDFMRSFLDPSQDVGLKIENGLLQLSTRGAAVQSSVVNSGNINLIKPAGSGMFVDATNDDFEGDAITFERKNGAYTPVNKPVERKYNRITTALTNISMCVAIKGKDIPETVKERVKVLQLTSETGVITCAALIDTNGEGELLKTIKHAMDNKDAQLFVDNYKVKNCFPGYKGGVVAWDNEACEFYVDKHV